MFTQPIDIPISTCCKARTVLVVSLKEKSFFLLPVPTLFNVGRLEQEEITNDNLKTILEREHRQVAFYEYLKQRLHFQAKGLGLL